MANIKISELNPLLTVEDADVLPIVDNAVTKKVTAAILRSYTQGNSVLLTGAQTVAGIKTFTSQLASSVATGTAPFSVASTTKVTNLNADLLDGLSSADFQATLSGTGIVKSTAGTISYLTDNSTNWNTAFNDSITSAAVTGSGTNTLTLTQQDAGTITATWVNGTLIREIRNTTGATLTKGTIVYISGATGNKPTVTKAIATTDETSSQTFGFVQENIANNTNGYVVIIGDLIGVDTSAFTEGDQLYLSSTVAGAFTDVKQYAPNHLVYVGIVTRAHPTLGQIEVNISNGFEMDELHNVAAQSPSNGDILQYVTSTGLWTKIAGTTSAISEGSNLYYTEARVNANTNVAANTAARHNAVTLGTANGLSLSTQALSLALASGSTTGALSSTDFSTFNAKQNAITLTTTGTSGAATLVGSTLNIPNYADTDTGITSLNGLTALTQTFAVGTSGTDFGISSATSTHTFNLPTASATNRGALSSADWTTFNNKQNALTNPITGTGTTNYLPKFTGASALGNSLLQETTNAIGLNVTPKAWGNNNKVFETTFSTSLLGRSDFSAFGRNFFYNSGDDPIYSNNGFASGYFQVDGEHLWVSAASGTAGNTISFAQTMTLKANGNLGIGTTSPSRKLTVQGDDDGTMQLRLQGTASTTSYWELGRESQSSGQFRIIASRTGTVITPMAIGDVTGNVLIGTTTDAGYKLDVNGTARVSGNLTATGNVSVGGTNQDSLLTINGSAGTSHARFREGSTTIGFIGGADGIISGQAGKLAIRGEAGLVLSGQGNSADVIISNTGAATFSSTLNAKAGSYINGASNSDWGFSVENTGTTNANGLYVNIGASSTGIPFRVDKGGSSLFNIANSGAATFSSSVTVSSGGSTNGRLGVRGTTNDSSAYAFEAANSSGSTLFIVRNDGVASIDGKLLIGTFTPGGSPLKAVGLPTSASGLSAGDIWNDGGTLKIV